MQAGVPSDHPATVEAEAVLHQLDAIEALKDAIKTQDPSQIRSKIQNGLRFGNSCLLGQRRHAVCISSVPRRVPTDGDARSTANAGLQRPASYWKPTVS